MVFLPAIFHIKKSFFCDAVFPGQCIFQIKICGKKHFLSQCTQKAVSVETYPSVECLKRQHFREEKSNPLKAFLFCQKAFLLLLATEKTSERTPRLCNNSNVFCDALCGKYSQVRRTRSAAMKDPLCSIPIHTQWSQQLTQRHLLTAHVENT